MSNFVSNFRGLWRVLFICVCAFKLKRVFSYLKKTTIREIEINYSHIKRLLNEEVKSTTFNLVRFVVYGFGPATDCNR